MVIEPENIMQEDDVAGDDRTGYALDRTVLANERTYTAWIRTGLASLAAGVAIEKFMVDALPDWTIRSIAIILIIYSMIAFIIAAWRYSHLGLKLVHIDVMSIPPIIMTGASVLLVCCSPLALVGIWLLGYP
jgi:putative membrane protein